MTLCDAGPLIGLVDRNDPHHARCVTALETHSVIGLVTTWPCFTEAMYMLGRAGGLRAQEELWSFIQDEIVTLHDPLAGEWERMRVLMKKYGDTPMDLADASLVTAAERLNVHRVFTLDRHFRAYRMAGARAFEVVP